MAGGAFHVDPKAWSARTLRQPARWTQRTEQEIQSTPLQSLTALGVFSGGGRVTTVFQRVNLKTSKFT